MLLFRSEEHVSKWAAQWKTPVGAIFSLSQAWDLASRWFAVDRGAPTWRRFTPTEAAEAFTAAGLVGEFWKLPG